MTSVLLSSSLCIVQLAEFLDSDKVNGLFQIYILVSHYLELSKYQSMFVFGFFHYKDFVFLSYFHAVASLAKPGTFAGNDAIVAFARNHQLNVVIHQLNAPLWQVGHLFKHLS